MNKPDPDLPRPCIHVLGYDCGRPDAISRLIAEREELFASAKHIVAPQKLADALGQYSWKFLQLTLPLDAFFQQLKEFAARSDKIIVLADGDPLLFGIGASLLRKFDRSLLRFEPALGSLQLASSKLGLPLHDIMPVSLHGRHDYGPLWGALRNGKVAAVFTDNLHTPAVIARSLVDRGAGGLKATVCERLGAPGEKIWQADLATCANQHFSMPNLLILQGASSHPGPRLGLDICKLRGSYASNKAVRGTALEFLRISPADTVWDIGAGSGLLALEIAAIAREAYAIETSAARAMDIQCNRAACQALNLSIVLGQAPGCLDGLPQPDKIFIGGGLSGSAREAILAECAKRLRPGGRIVATFILLESFQAALAFFKATGWPLECAQVSLAWLAPLGAGQHLHPTHPIFVIGAEKSAAPAPDASK